MLLNAILLTDGRLANNYNLQTVYKACFPCIVESGGFLVLHIVHCQLVGFNALQHDGRSQHCDCHYQ